MLESPKVAISSSISPANNEQTLDQMNEKAHTLGKTTTKDADFLTGIRFYTVFLALVAMTLLLTLDASIMATAIPRITDEFHTIADVGWYGSAYLIANASLQPLTGKVYTFFPMKLSFFVFVGLFELGSIISATATSSMMLIVGRAFSGVGGSGLANGALCLINVSTPPKQRPTIMGIMMSMFAAGQVLGPLVGGSLTQHVSWRWCFWINLPVGAVSVAALLMVRLPPQEDRPKITRKNYLKNFDLVGFVFFAPASITLLLGLQWGGIKYEWASPNIIALLVCSGIIYIIFIIWEYHQGEHAMFATHIIRRREIYSGILLLGFFGGSLLVFGYYLPIWFQVVKHASPTDSAVYTLPTFISMILFATITGPISNRIGLFAPIALVGTAISAIGLGLMITFSPTTTVGEWIGYQILGGAGRGLAIPQPINEAQAILPKSQLPTGMALIIWAQFFGGAVCLALAQTAFTSLLKSALQTFAPDIDPSVVIQAGATNFQYVIPEARVYDVLRAYNQAVTQTFWLAAMLGVVATFASLGLRWKKIASKKEDAKKDEQQEQQDGLKEESTIDVVEDGTKTS